MHILKKKRYKTSQKKSNLILDNRLEFLYDLHNSNIPIGDDKENLLRKHGYIKIEDDGYTPKIPVTINKALNTDDTVKSENEQIADSFVDVVDSSAHHQEVLTIDEYEQNKDFKYKGKKQIKTSEWKPSEEEALNYPKDFVRWIDSINTGFANMIPYERFRLYVQQSEMWIAENTSYSDYSVMEEQLDFAREEKKRCTDNSLYFLNKYHLLKEGDIAGGGRRFKAWDCQEVVCYLFDCGYNILIGKPRQIGFTSTIGGLCEKRIIFHKSYFVKFITKSLQKGVEIFEDKIKFPLYHVPDWMRPTVKQ